MFGILITPHFLQKQNITSKKTDKTSIFLETGEELIDGMSSWWSAIHGYNNPKLTQALKTS